MHKTHMYQYRRCLDVFRYDIFQKNIHFDGHQTKRRYEVNFKFPHTCDHFCLLQSVSCCYVYIDSSIIELTAICKLHLQNESI